jgi:5-methylthioadenosine/S-adenosylhomocysteine deaminase
MAFGIKGKWVIGFDGEEHRLIRDGVVIIEGKHIKYVGKSYDGSVLKWINADHHVVSPGFICTHCHAATSPKDKSFIDDTGARHFYMSSLGENLTALGQSIKKEDYPIYARYSIAELLRSGCTTVLEIGTVSTLGEENAAKLFEETGIRAFTGPGVSDGVWERSEGADLKTRWLGLEKGLKDLRVVEAFNKRFSGASDGRLNPAILADTVDKCSATLQKEIRVKADQLKIPITIHAAQWVVEFQNMLRMYRRTPIEFLADTGLLGRNLIIGHGWAVAGHPLVSYPPVGEGDLGLLARSGATVSHDPLVFIKRGNKMHSHSKYLQAGVNVSIGCDTSPQDMLNEMRMASYTSKLADWDCYSGSAKDVYTSATIGGANGLGRSDLGRIVVGALADIVVIDMESLNNVPCRDPVKNIVNSANRSDVKHVIVNGELVVDDGVLKTVDEEKLVREVQKATEAVWSRIPENHYLKQTADEVSPQSFKLWEE